MPAWDANVPASDPECFHALPKRTRDDLLAWVERHIGPDRYIFRAETDLLDAPLLRVWSIPKDALADMPVTDDGSFDAEVQELLMREPIPASALSQE